MYLYLYNLWAEVGLKAITDEPRNSPAGATKPKFENVFPYVTKAECAEGEFGANFLCGIFFCLTSLKDGTQCL
jgi:hypothetical protein